MTVLLTGIDWTLDALALLASIAIAWRMLDLSVRDGVTVLLAFSIYTLHEMWEAGLIGGTSHTAFEEAVYTAIQSL